MAPMNLPTKATSSRCELVQSTTRIQYRPRSNGASVRVGSVRQSPATGTRTSGEGEAAADGDLDALGPGSAARTPPVQPAKNPAKRRPTRGAAGRHLRPVPVDHGGQHARRACGSAILRQEHLVRAVATGERRAPRTVLLRGERIRWGWWRRMGAQPARRAVISWPAGVLAGSVADLAVAPAREPAAPTRYQPSQAVNDVTAAAG